jgi:putative transposase
MEKFTTFDKIMELIDQQFLEKCIEQTESDKWVKVFTTPTHLAAMVFAQLMNCKSLRELVIQFNAMDNKNYPEIKRSTIADANVGRSTKVFEAICLSLVEQGRPDIKSILRILDSSPILISGRRTEWTLNNAIPRIQGLKVHIRLAPQESAVDQVVITPPNVNDICVAKTWDIVPGTINVFDKGYFDFNWWYKIHTANAFFVSRMKKNTSYIVEKENDLPPGTRPEVESDQLIRLKNKNPRGGKVNLLAGTILRLIKYQDPINQKTYFFVSNLLESSAEEIAKFYKIRWDIELFFKWLKQNLKLKTFLGASENSIKIQIYVALIAFMLLQKLKSQLETVHTRLKDFVSLIKIAICKSFKFLQEKFCCPNESRNKPLQRELRNLNNKKNFNDCSLGEIS